MRKTVVRSGIAVLLGSLIGSAALAAGAERSAEVILKDLDAAKLPSIDMSKRGDQDYVQKYIDEMKRVGAQRDVLILELFNADPDNARLPGLMNEHWRRLPPIGPNAAKLDKEIATVLARAKHEPLRLEAYFARAQAALYTSAQTGNLDLAGVDEFLKKAPKDPRAPHLLYMAAQSTKDEKIKSALEDRLVKEFPQSPIAAAIEGIRRRAESIGKPFELEFNDAISGSTVSIKNLKGKVVVIDFWATWCGPCVAEMPNMKKLYAKYHDRGVEFIGVSLDAPKDQGGLDKLKKYVKENEIHWPQYYQGNGWQSDFSVSWGINSIPAMFLVDAEGKLVSVEARGKLDELIPELLKKKGGEVKSPAGGE